MYAPKNEVLFVLKMHGKNPHNVFCHVNQSSLTSSMICKQAKRAAVPLWAVVCHVLQGGGAVTGWEPRGRGARVRP